MQSLNSFSNVQPRETNVLFCQNMSEGNIQLRRPGVYFCEKMRRNTLNNLNILNLYGIFE